MRTWLITGVALSVAMLALTTIGLGQEGAMKGPLRFDPKTVATVQGIVVDAPALHPGGILEMVHLTLKTDQERLTVVLGPNWFIAQQGWRLTALDHLEVTGSRLVLEGKPALVAQEVKKGSQVMQFRDRQGKPLWAPTRQQTN